MALIHLTAKDERRPQQIYPCICITSYFAKHTVLFKLCALFCMGNMTSYIIFNCIQYGGS